MLNRSQNELSSPKTDDSYLQNSPDHRTQSLHLLHLWQGQSCQVGEAVQLGVHLQHPLSAATVSRPQVVAVVRDEGSHH